MKYIVPIENFWDELLKVTNEYWVQVAVFCLFVAVIFFTFRLFFNL